MGKGEETQPMCTCLLWPSAPGVVHPCKHAADQLQACVPLEGKGGEERTVTVRDLELLLQETKKPSFHFLT